MLPGWSARGAPWAGIVTSVRPDARCASDSAALAVCEPGSRMGRGRRSALAGAQRLLGRATRFPRARTAGVVADFSAGRLSPDAGGLLLVREVAARTGLWCAPGRLLTEGARRVLRDRPWRAFNLERFFAESPRSPAPPTTSGRTGSRR